MNEIKNNTLWLILKELEELNENMRTNNAFLSDIKQAFVVEEEVKEKQEPYEFNKDGDTWEVKYKRGPYKKRK